MQNKLFFFILAFLVVLTSCEDKPVTPETTFEKKDILENLADNWIAPKYTELKEKTDSLDECWELFVANQTPYNFELVKTTWKSAYLSFQNVKFIDFGPAMDNSFPLALGTFPSDTSLIEANISSGSYDLTTMNNSSAVGLAALDYLLFRNDAFSQVQAENGRRTYISGLIQKIKTETDYVVSNWPAYRATFVDGSGTSSTSPFSKLVNAFCKDFELAKNTKLGIPLGKQSLGIQRLDYLEAPRSKLGKELLIANIKALQAVYLGMGGSGFDDYLVTLEKKDLNAIIQSRFNDMISTAGSWQQDLKQMMLSSSAEMDAYYVYMHNSVVYIKTDMTSSFGVLITYQDNDGD